LGEDKVRVVGGIVDFDVGFGIGACWGRVSNGRRGRGRGKNLPSDPLWALGAGASEEEVDEAGRGLGVDGWTVEVVNEDDWTVDVVGGDVELLEAVEEED